MVAHLHLPGMRVCEAAQQLLSWLITCRETES